MKRIAFFGIGLLALVVTSLASAAPLKVKLEGLDSELEENASLYLEALPPIEHATLPKLRARITEEISHALQALGYYHPIISISHPGQDQKELLITVEPGSPIIIRKFKLELLGDASEDETFIHFKDNLPLKEGQVLNDGKYESIKSSLTNLALAHGYFDASLSQHSIKVYPEENAADIAITLNAGHRYRFGTVQYGDISESTIHLLEYLINFKVGQPYDSVKLGKLTQDISSTGYFRQIDVHPVKTAIKNREVPIYIGVTPRLKHEFLVGAGYSTDEGPRVFFNWDKPWVNQYGHSLSNEAVVSAKRAEVTSSYKIPAGNPLQDYYNLQLGYQRKLVEDTDSKLLSTSVHRWTKRSYRKKSSWDQDVFFRIEYEDYEQGLQQDNNLLLIPGVSFSRRRIRGGTDPWWGDQQLAKVELSSRSWGSDANFIKVWGRTKWLRTLAQKHRIITRMEQGAIWMLDDITDIPPSLRFFAGGDQSIRGFAYESISPKDSKGKLTGARYMTAGSLEYAYSFAEKWRVATFVDSGTATNDYNDKWKTGAGFGLRWVSPLGQIKLDLAFAVSEENKPWRLHFTMGPEL